MRRPVLTLLLTLGLAAPALADTKLQPVPDGPPPGVTVPPPPEIIRGDNGEPVSGDLEPQVTIKEGPEGQKVEEYRVHGRLYMIKVTPKSAPVYYVVDRDGDGTFETTFNGPIDRISIPQWVLIKW